MNRRAVLIGFVVLGAIGAATVLAQQNSRQEAVPQQQPIDLHHGAGNLHYSGVAQAAGAVTPLSQHLAVARSQLMEARREVNPSARIDRVITALDELVLALSYVEGGGVHGYDGGYDYHSDHHAGGAVAHSGGCN